MDGVIYLDGVELAQEGDVLADTGGFALMSFGSGPVQIDAPGRVLWFGDWNDPDTDVDTGLFLDDGLIVQEGVTTVGGQVIDSLAGIQDGYALSPSGSFVVFEAVLANGREGAFRLALPIGDRYYSPANANSTGLPATLTALGSPVAGGNPLRLAASDLPLQQFGDFLASQTQDFVANLGGTIARFSKQVQSSGPDGRFAIEVDTTAIPTSPPSAIQPGESWNFQAWYRDVDPTPTSNFTDAVEIAFR